MRESRGRREWDEGDQGEWDEGERDWEELNEGVSGMGGGAA